jgi:serine/threonine protein phosphatase PrpC
MRLPAVWLCETVVRVYYESQSDIQTALREAFCEANREIYEPTQNDEALKGMGATCTALVLRSHSAICAHVGDSRLYMVRRGRVRLNDRRSL